MAIVEYCPCWPVLAPLTGTLQAFTTLIANEANFVSSLAWLSQGQWRDAAQALEDAYADTPRDLTAAYLGAIYWQLDEPITAARWWSRSESAPALLVTLAEWCTATGQTTGPARSIGRGRRTWARSEIQRTLMLSVVLAQQDMNNEFG